MKDKTGFWSVAFLVILLINFKLLNILPAIILTIVLFLLGWLLVLHIQKNRTIKKIGKRYEHFYLVEIPPSGNVNIPLPKELIVTARKGAMGKTKQRMEDMIVASHNHMDIKVKAWFFQSGRFINETEEDYFLRVTNDIKADRSTRHEDLFTNNKFYMGTHHKEYLVIEWDDV